MTGPGTDATIPEEPPRLAAVQAYLLGTLDFETFASLQRRLAYEVAGEPTSGAVILCDHPPGLTIGRQGSRSHIRLSPEQLAARRWDLRWVARGGGVALHLPGQVACYPILPLAALGLRPVEYLQELMQVVVDLAAEFRVPATTGREAPAVFVHGRRLAQFGVAFRQGVTSFGFVLNVAPDLELFRDVDCDGGPVPMTSLQREAILRIRIPTVRQRLLELLGRRLGFGRLAVFHNHPTFLPRTPRHAIPARPR